MIRALCFGARCVLANALLNTSAVLARARSQDGAATDQGSANRTLKDQTDKLAI